MPKSRRCSRNALHGLKECGSQFRLLFSAKLSAVTGGEKLPSLQKIERFLLTKPTLSTILKTILLTDERDNHRQETVERKHIKLLTAETQSTTKNTNKMAAVIVHLS